MNADQDVDQKAQEETLRTKPVRDGEEAGISNIDPPPADGGKVRDPGQEPPVGSMR